MRMVIVAVGRVKQPALRGAIDEYLKRLKRYADVREHEVADGPTARVEAALTRLTEGTSRIALEVDGEALSSEHFAARLERFSMAGKGDISFMIGGADGLPPALSKASDARWSLSALTFPHRLARLVLVEQIYRAMTILRNEPYAH